LKLYNRVGFIVSRWLELLLFDRILNQMRECIRACQYVMTTHAEEEMNDDGLTVYDVESVILSGTIEHRQKDTNTGEWKYLVKGKTISNDDAIVVGKLACTGKLVLITIYRE
jgi:hypothetical protein